MKMIDALIFFKNSITAESGDYDGLVKITLSQRAFDAFQKELLQNSGYKFPIHPTLPIQIAGITIKLKEEKK